MILGRCLRVYRYVWGNILRVDREVERTGESIARFCSSFCHFCSSFHHFCSECLWLSGNIRCFTKALQGQHTLRLGNTAIDSPEFLRWASVAGTMWRGSLREWIFVFRTVQAWKVYMAPRKMFARKPSPSYSDPSFLWDLRFIDVT